MNPLAPVIPPDLIGFVRNQIASALADTNCHQLGEIKSFDAQKQTAEVALSVLLKIGNTTKPFPLLVDVPVFVLGGGNRVITFPIQAGDTCLVLFNDKDIDNWFSAGGTPPPSSQRVHDLSDGLALVGFRNLGNPVADYSTEDVEIRNEESKIVLGEKIALANATTDLKTVLEAVITALNTINAVKVGGNASPQIVIANTLVTQLLKTL